MTRGLKDSVVEQAPDDAAKLFTPVQFVAPTDDSPDIADPIAQGIEAYERTANRLARLISPLPSVLRAWLDA